MNYDVFISYEHTVKSVADNIASVLERNKIRCWYAPRDVIGDYATSIVEAIDNSKVFVVILSEESSSSPHVLNEVEIAYKRVMDNSITIIPFKVDDKELSRAMEYYVKRLHWIDVTNSGLDLAIDDLLKKVNGLLGFDKRTPDSQKARSKSSYYVSEREEKRLLLQSRLLKRFDGEVYEKILNNYPTVKALDLGSNDGNFIMDRIGAQPNLKCLVGIEREQCLVDAANAKYKSDKIAFYALDMEADSFADDLQAVLTESGIQTFDIINISMVLLHLKNPHKLLKIARHFLSADGTLLIKDIDDGLNFAYPDEDGAFERVYGLCSKSETSGFRKNGRQIYSCLKRAGYGEVQLAKVGLNNIGMSFEEKEIFFNSYFAFILGDMEWMYKKYPNDKELERDYLWYRDCYDHLAERFLSNDYLFSLGFMMYLAKKTKEKNDEKN